MSFMSKFITKIGSSNSNSSSISTPNLRHTYQHKLTRWMLSAHSDYRAQVRQFLLCNSGDEFQIYLVLPW